MCFAPQRRALFRLRSFQKWSKLVCFVHFDFEMCFAPQRRALFRHLNFQKCSDHGVFCTFWLRNVLRATTACNFSSLIWPAGSASAALASLLFDPPEPQIIGKTQWIATFLPFRASYSFSSTLISSNLSLLSAFSLLCFSSVHIVGSLTSKLPSNSDSNNNNNSNSNSNYDHPSELVIAWRFLRRWLEVALREVDMPQRVILQPQERRV